MKRFLYILSAPCLLLLMFACNNNNHPEGNLSIKPANLQMQVGEMEMLELNVGGETIDNNQADWMSSNEEIVTVKSGIITALKDGVAEIFALYNQHKASCMVMVGTGIEEPVEDLSKAVGYLSKSAKRGVKYSFAQFPEEDVAALAPFISWSYNWGSQPSTTTISNLFDEYNLDYFPMAWNGVNEVQIRSYKQTHPNCEYILAFNEPNLTDQANMTPAQAARKWPELKALADELGLKIVSPAMNYGTLSGYSDPEKWLDEFFTLVPKSDIYAIALHCYMGSAGAMHNYIHKFDKYQLPIWMTEFCSWDRPAPGSVEAQINYMNEAVVMMEAETNVERYAWFIPRAGGAVDSYPYMQLLSKDNIGQLSPQGEVYAALSSFDKTTWLSTQAPILPNTYSNCSAAETIKNGTFEAVPHLQPTTDNAGRLMMTDMVNGKWVEYQLDVKQPTNAMILRYIGVTGSTLTISVDGEKTAEVNLEWSDMKWKTKNIELKLSAGHHTLRLSNEGNIYFNWLKFE